MDPNEKVSHFISKGIVLVIDIVVFSFLVQLLWNYLAPVLGIVTLTYKQAIAAFLLSRFLLKDHLLSSEPTIVHCDCDEEVDEKKTQ